MLDKDDACPETYGDGGDGCPSEGSHVFWFDADATGNWDGNVSIYINGSYVGEITEWYNENPGCDASGCVTVTYAPGTYKWSARSEIGGEWEGGTFEISAGDCGELGLYVY